MNSIHLRRCNNSCYHYYSTWVKKESHCDLASFPSWRGPLLSVLCYYPYGIAVDRWLSSRSRSPYVTKWPVSICCKQTLVRMAAMSLIAQSSMMAARKKKGPALIDSSFTSLLRHRYRPSLSLLSRSRYETFDQTKRSRSRISFKGWWRMERLRKSKKKREFPCGPAEVFGTGRAGDALRPAYETAHDRTLSVQVKGWHSFWEVKQ